MTLPDAESLARQLPSFPHADRVRALVRFARDHAADPALGPLLDGLAARSDYHAGLVLAAARAIGDVKRVRALSRSAVPGTDDLATRYLSLPLNQRRALEHRIRATRRTDMAAILLSLPLADADRARLLASADEPTARSLIADLGDLLPSLAALARRHPGVVLDELARRLEDAAPVQRDRAWAWACTAYAPLAASLPGGVIALLLTAGPTRVIPDGLDPHLGRLLRHNPSAVGALLARAPHDVGQRHLTTASARLVKSLHRALHLLTVPERIALARAGRDDDGRLAAILAALPPRDREEVLDGALDGIDTTHRHYSDALLEVLPRARRQREAQRMAALPDAASALAQLSLAGFLPPDQAMLQAAPRIHALGAEERAQAWAALIASAGRGRDADALTDVLLRLGALDHEQDPVRLVVARALASIPLSVLANCPLTPLEGFTRAAVRAQDASTATQWTLQGLAWALIDHAIATGGSPTAPARLLEAAVGDEPRLWHPPITPGRALAAAAVEALAKRLREESLAGECGLLLDLHSALGRRANGDRLLDSLLVQALDSPVAADRLGAAVAWLADPATRGERVAELVRRDESFAALRPVTDAIATMRQDLVEILFLDRPLRGRFWHREHTYLALLPKGARGWDPEHLASYASALRRRIDARTTTRPERHCALIALARIPATTVEDLRPWLDDGAPETRASALGALAHLSDPEAALREIVHHAGEDWARTAFDGAMACAARLDPAMASKILTSALSGPIRMSARKEALRVLARLHRPADLPTLTGAAMARDTRPDVRLAAARAMIAWLDAPEAWTILAHVATEGRDAALALSATSPRHVADRHRPRYARLLLAAAREPELIAALGEWGDVLPDLPRFLESIVRDGAPAESAAAIIAIAGHSALSADWSEHLAVLRRLARGAAPNAQPGADPPHPRRMESLAAAMIPDDGASLRWHREHLEAMSALLEDIERDSRPLGAPWASRLAATDWEDEVACLASLERLAGATGDASLAGELVKAAAAALKRARRLRLLPESGIPISTADALLRRQDAAGAALALAIVTAQGQALGWPEPWRDRLRELRGNGTGIIALLARRARAAAE
ncbi:hypothetical protein [Actinomyces sp. zg328]|uniref:hypothetical protein n=1 Tax=Actinomyces sp. zg328 TaxID=2609287 RepID=UPI00135A76AD|nr:hypothetical protein [Actinomyces sp. zg328]